MGANPPLRGECDPEGAGRTAALSGSRVGVSRTDMALYAQAGLAAKRKKQGVNLEFINCLL